MLPSKHFPFSISIAGVPLVELVTRDISEIVVNTNLHMPGMFSIRLKDENLAGTQVALAYKYIDNPLFPIGAPISIKAIKAEESLIPPDIPMPLIIGEITGLEAEFESDGSASLVIRGYDKSHRLHVGKKTRTFLMMPDNLIAMQVAGQAGVPLTAIPTPGAREYVLQNNQTDWDFLQGLAERNNYTLAMTPLGVLTFKPSGVPGGLPAALTWGKNLMRFNPRVSALGQVSAVTVQGWDPKLKFPITGLFVVPPPAPAGGPTVLADFGLSHAFGATSKYTIVDQPQALATDAMAIATARARAISSEFVKAEGECMGNPGVQAGSPIAVLGGGVRFSGPYLVSSATHVWSPNSGYTTQFSVTGSRSDTLNDLLGKEDGKAQGRAWGVVIGLVTNNLDPLQLGRVKVRFPHLGSLPPVESNWCRVASPMGGPLSGFYAIPEINDEVLVAFEHGDPNYPYVLGSLWNNLDRPPLPTAAVVLGGKVTKRVIKSRSGHTITLDDTPGREGIAIVDKMMANKLEIDTTKKSMSITVLGDVSITAATGDIKIGAMAKDVTIDCLNFKVNAKANASITALANVDFKATANLKLLATAQFEAQGLAGAKISSPAIAEIKGVAMTKVG